MRWRSRSSWPWYGADWERKTASYCTSCSRNHGATSLSSSFPGAKGAHGEAHMRSPHICRWVGLFLSTSLDRVAAAVGHVPACFFPSSHSKSESFSFSQTKWKWSSITFFYFFLFWTIYFYSLWITEKHRGATMPNNAVETLLAFPAQREINIMAFSEEATQL